MYQPGTTPADLRSLLGFMDLTQSSRLNLAHYYVHHLPYLFPGQNLSVDSNPHVYAFMRNLFRAEEVLNTLRELAEASNALGG